MGGCLLQPGQLALAKAVPFEHLPQDTLGEAIEFIIENLRPADLDEIRASVPGDPGEIIRASATASVLGWIILDRTGLPIGLFGAADGGLGRVGIPWMVGTPGLEQEAHALARHTRRYVGEMLRTFPVLTNFVDARNTAALDWLLWAGFHLIDADPRHGPEERLFLQFSRTS